MKAKVSRGSGFRGALNYALDPAKGAEIIGGTMSGTDPRELAKEFSLSRQLRPDIKKPVWHCSLSLPPGETLTNDKWQEISNTFMQKMGFDPSTQWVAVLHKDTVHSHIHIVASRIGLDGKVWLGKWEARQAIEVTQELEQEFGLTLTPGLDDIKAERKKLTKNEIEQALRTGEEPVRQRLQRLLDQAMQDKPTITAFIERLQAAGVSVQVNMASTGRVSGISFSLDGISFKGSALGKKYSWAGLQKAGISYEQDRDSEKLRQFAPTAGDRGRGAGFAIGDEGAAPRSDELAPPSPAGGRDREGPGSDAGDPAAGLGRDGGVHDREGDGIHRAEDVEARPDAAKTGDAARLPDDRAAGDEGDRQGTDGRDRDSEGVAMGAGDSGDRVGGGNRHGDRLLRFKIASAARRRAAEGAVGGRGLEPGDAERKRVTEADRRAARETDPTAYLESRGFTVRRDGRRFLSVRAGGEEIYRLTLLHEGYWVWCDKMAEKGGDLIDLVREIEGPGTRYSDAVYRLLGGRSMGSQRPSRPAPPPPPSRPRLPMARQEDRDAGRTYLRSRGISAAAIEAAEKAGMLRYAGGAILFCGYDEKGEVRAVTRRATDPADPVQKRDLAGTNKSYPAILPGDPAKVWIVEGGVDALAVYDMARRRGRTTPTILVSGGAAVRGFLDTPHVQEMLKRARRIVIACEREKDEATQQRTDRMHEWQRDAVAKVAPDTEVRLWWPDHGKDAAEMNRHEAARDAEIVRQREAGERMR